MTFPVIHSTLDPVALAKEIDRRYKLDRPVVCRQISRGNNDIYRVDAGGTTYALRISKANFRTHEAYDFEAEYTRHLAAKGLSVPAPLACRNGLFHFSLDAPEGLRTVMVLAWLNGAPLGRDLSMEDARAAGTLLASAHLAAGDFVSTASRPVSVFKMIEDRLRYLEAAVQRTPDGGPWLKTLASKVIAAAPADEQHLPSGAIHGDAQFENILKYPDGRLALIDFDTCGTGRFVEDICTFIWRADMAIGRDEIIESFLRGYEEVRPLTDKEKALLPFFRLARSMAMAATYAWLVRRVGPISGFDEGLAPLIDQVRNDASAVGISI